MSDVGSSSPTKLLKHATSGWYTEPPATTTRECRPWSKPDFARRRDTFVHCLAMDDRTKDELAGNGWTCMDDGQIVCEMCKIAAAAERDARHRPTCPWTNMSFVDLTPQAAIDNAIRKAFGTIPENSSEIEKRAVAALAVLRLVGMATAGIAG